MVDGMEHSYSMHGHTHSLSCMCHLPSVPGAETEEHGRLFTKAYILLKLER